MEAAPISCPSHPLQSSLNRAISKQASPRLYSAEQSQSKFLSILTQQSNLRADPVKSLLSKAISESVHFRPYSAEESRSQILFDLHSARQSQSQLLLSVFAQQLCLWATSLEQSVSYVSYTQQSNRKASLYQRSNLGADRVKSLLRR